MKDCYEIEINIFCAKYSLIKFPKGLFQYSPFFPNQRWFNMRDCCSRGRLLVRLEKYKIKATTTATTTTTTLARIR